MGKYTPFEMYLKSIQKDQLVLSFKEIEQILNSTLPDSAYEYRQWWENDSYHSQSKAWKNASWKVDEVDFTKELIRFRRQL